MRIFTGAHELYGWSIGSTGYLNRYERKGGEFVCTGVERCKLIKKISPCWLENTLHQWWEIEIEQI